MMYPLGQDIFATVKPWRGTVKLYVRRYKKPTNTKGGRLVPRQGGLSLELAQFQKLLKMKERLVTDFDQLKATSRKPNPSQTTSGNPQTSPPTSNMDVTTPATTTSVTSPEDPGSYLTQIERLDCLSRRSSVNLESGSGESDPHPDIVEEAMVQAGITATRGNRQLKLRLPQCSSVPNPVDAPPVATPPSLVPDCLVYRPADSYYAPNGNPFAVDRINP